MSKKILTVLSLIVLMACNKAVNNTPSTNNLINAKNGVASNSYASVQSYSNIGVAVGFNGIYRTLNGGQTWTQVFSNNSIILSSVTFSSDTNGVASGFDVNNRNGVIFRTTDAGQTWTQVFNAPYGFGPIRSVAFSTPTNGLATVGQLIYSTQDCGQTWTLLNDVNTFADVVFSSATNGIAVGKNYIYRTIDGGQTWTNVFVNNNPTSVFGGVTLSHANSGLALSYDNVYNTQDSGKTWTLVNIGGFYGAAFSTDTNAVGLSRNNSVIYLSQNGGKTWTNTYSNSKVTFNNIAFSSATNGVVIGFDKNNNNISYIYLTTNGGRTWAQVLQSNNVIFMAVAFAHSN